ncbi:HAUS augmin-like complex subunit 6 [Pollicipes pollicipes]|uniref:HAUS augmin-like complex subunit 6 n=1 Tax=Pollicipes pollicipes TaxID=41117 RepID=UPI0018851E6A|nr:HAUS augmin-like complex subunit 6 [Pollicipes pollicipes]
MSVAELLHSNLCLLGYEKEASGSKVLLSDETFEHANERAFQSVVHFLLRALDEERCRQTFRHCWPVHDKRQSSVYRQAVVAWLKEIKQNDPDAASMPVINPALFLSPGGRKFKDLLLALTQFVMLKTLRELDRELPGSEILLERGSDDIQYGALRASCALSKQRFVQLQKRKLISHSHHQRFADSFSTSYRRLRQSAVSLTQELGRLVGVSGVPAELTHRLLQEEADQVVPAVYAAARQHLAALEAGLERLRQFCREAAFSWSVVDSIVSGAVADSVVDAHTLVPLPPADAAQGPSELLLDGKLDLVAFFETFVKRVDQLQLFLTQCPIAELKSKTLSMSARLAASAGARGVPDGA